MSDIPNLTANRRRTSPSNTGGVFLRETYIGPKSFDFWVKKRKREVTGEGFTGGSTKFNS